MADHFGANVRAALDYSDSEALKTIHDYLGDVAYPFMDCSLVAETDRSVLPHFDAIQSNLKRAHPLYKLLFSLLRQGHVCDEYVLRKFLPPAVFEAMVAVGLLECGQHKEWRTPSVILLSIEGLLLLVHIPVLYPTCRHRAQPTYVGPDSIAVIRALPSYLNGESVLDVCAGSAIHGLVCAARGAGHVVCLEISPEAVEMARFNVALNQLQSRVEVRQSDLLAGLTSEERFDLIVSSPPSLAAPRESGLPVSIDGGTDGMEVLCRLLQELRTHSTPSANAIVYACSIGSQHSIYFNRGPLKEIAINNRLNVRGFVHRKSEVKVYREALDLLIRSNSPNVPSEERASSMEEWLTHLKADGLEVSHVYDQILRVCLQHEHVGVATLPKYDPVLTDPLSSMLVS